MKNFNFYKNIYIFAFFSIFLFTFLNCRYGNVSNYLLPPQSDLPDVFKYSPIIKEIKIEGLLNIPKEAIMSKLTIEEGNILDSKKCSKIAKNIYNLGYFSDVKIEYEISEDKSEIIIIIKLNEKKRLFNITIQGNDHISQETMEKKFNLSKIFWIDNQSCRVLCEKIKKLYLEKQYYKVEIGYEMKPLENGSIELIIKVNEGVYGKIRSINFKGNKNLSRNQLKEPLASKEYWLLGFLDRGGVFRKEMVDFDRYQLESFYQSKGFYEAKVTSVNLEEYEDGMIDVVFKISEGPIYKFGEIKIPEDNSISYFEARRIVSIEKGDIYSRETIKNACNNLKIVLGEKGYMYANVYPKMKINKENNTIDVEFIFEKGKPVFVRTINIKGNTTTQENVIRREILLDEGELLTSKKLEDSKRSVESLGFFAPNTGVQWNLNTIDAYQADLDLIVQPAKTGKFYFNMGIKNGADAGKHLQMLDSQQSDRWYDTLLTTSRIGLTLQNTNYRGRGLRYYIDGSYSNVDRSLSCGLATNWFLDLPLSAGTNLSFRNVIYNDFSLSANTPNERNESGNLQLGFRSHLLDMTMFGLEFGINNISYAEPIVPKLQFPESLQYQTAYSEMVRRSFEPGLLLYTTLSVSNDKRNHPVRPSMGYQWILDSKIAIPNKNPYGTSNFGYIRTGIDAKWYTPLIQAYDIILFLRGYGGIIYNMPGCNIPYKELYHVGGPQSVRGFLYGQIGPLLFGSSIGAKKSFFVNAEIQCPISKVNGMVVVLFYDGGAGWDTIFKNEQIVNENLPIQNYLQSNSPDMLIKNNTFRYRHAVGFGLRITSPAPIRIDWGFKLDRNKKIGESLHEVNISMETSY